MSQQPSLSPIEVYQAIWPLHLIGWIVAALAVVVMGYAIARNMKQQNKNSFTSSSFALGCILAILADFILRYGFYYIHI